MNPKVYISYSWSSPDHEAKVVQFATDLSDNGVDIILDKWDLKEGHDANAFMERMVSDQEIKKVILVCDRVYAEKADKRKGGVGTEAQIISPEIYNQQEQSKFVAVIFEVDDDGKPYVPVYYKSRIHIDLSDELNFTSEFERLLRWIYDRPLYTKPPIGAAPDFLQAESTISLGTSTHAKRVIESVRHGRNWEGATKDYYQTFVANLPRFDMEFVEGEEADETMIRNVGSFIPARDEFNEVLRVLIQYGDATKIASLVHEFFDNCQHLITGRYERGNAKENFDFLIHELFLYTVTTFLKSQQFEALGRLLSSPFYCSDHHGQGSMYTFAVFSKPLGLLHQRKLRLNSRQISLQADLLKSRSSVAVFRDLMQSDLVLFLRHAADCLNTSFSSTRVYWDPCPLIYAEHMDSPFEIFVRAQSKEYFDSLIRVFGMQQFSEFDNLMTELNEGKRVRQLVINHFATNINALIGRERLRTRA